MSNWQEKKICLSHTTTQAFTAIFILPWFVLRSGTVIDYVKVYQILGLLPGFTISPNQFKFTSYDLDILG